MNKSDALETRDRGAVLVFVAVFLTVAMILVAFVVDIGFAFVERRQLQNGADAAALAVAQDCAEGSCGDFMTTATQAAGYNATSDGVSAVDFVCGSGGGLPACADGYRPPASQSLGWVRVRTSTLENNGSPVLRFLLGLFVGSEGATIRAAAVAAWGIAGSGRALPFVLHECKLNEMEGPDFPSYPSGEVILYAMPVDTSGKSSDCRQKDGKGPSGNFGWVPGDSTCLVELDLSTPIVGDGGKDANPLKKNCDNGAAIQDQTVLIAIYNDWMGQGGGGGTTYYLVGFLGFRVTGYDMAGRATWPAGFSCPSDDGKPNDGSFRCFRGYFTTATFDGDFGGSYNTGVTSVKMIG
ncbi:MAG: pilus assembly protein TadG-related protein [Ilumatobacteraceae bacterium]